MGRLREIQRTATFAWSNSITQPALATGTRAGAVDADFSDETKLELWDLGLEDVGAGTELKPSASISTDSRFYDIAWSPSQGEQTSGIIAGALESGSLDLWNASRLASDPTNALLSRTTKHGGAIKALQFNPHKPELLASAGAKGEVYITDINNATNPFRLGAATARADDYDCLDWNKKVPHIMVTGGNGGFVTVWDVRAKKENLTLNNYGRKPVSAIAWNPEMPTKLATAIPTDQDPLILMWDLKNSSAPELVLKGHDQGILSLSWCAQDNNLLLSSGKDNRNICWNAQSGQMYGEFPIVTNWTFQTRWSPSQPNLLATASFDGKIAVQTLQSTNAKEAEGATATAAADGEDFFARAQTQPQASTFTLPTPPKWMKRPAGVAFGFGGKLVNFKQTDTSANRSTVHISTYSGDTGVAESVTEFEQALKQDDFSQLCETKISEAQSSENKNDWEVIKTLLSASPRKGILAFLGFEDAIPSNDEAKLSLESQDSLAASTQTNGAADKSNRLSAFFDNSGESGSFLSELAASKGARTNNPFQIFTGSETEADKSITRALMLGKFEEALDICLKEKRMSDAFMIAICGGQKCIDKAQAAYFDQQAEGPNHTRLLASIVGKNLWDVVYNADMKNWAEVMATLCTYADENEFPDLCETLGDRLDELEESREHASFCYLAGSKLEKVVPIWIREMQKTEQVEAKEAEKSAFSVHVQNLQRFIEKVSVFRSVTGYEDKEAKEKTSDWRLEPLYARYAEYAEIVCNYGHLDLAEQYLELLPNNYPAADIAKNRVKQASGKTPARTQRSQPAAPIQSQFVPAAGLQPNAVPPTAMRPTSTPTAYTPATSSYTPMGAGAGAGASVGYQPPSAIQNTGYQPPGAGIYAPPALGGFQPPQPMAAQSQGPPPTGPPPPKNQLNGGNWNDLPESFAKKPPSRRATPVTAPINSAYAPQPFANTPPPGPPNAFGQPPPQQRTSSPLPPPPKMGQPPSMAAPPRSGSPLVDRSFTGIDNRQASQATNAYAPSVPSPQNLAQPSQTLPPRASSPYNPPPSAPSTSSASRYAPAPGTQGTAAPPPVGGRPPIAPNPYAQQHQMQPQSMPVQSQPPPRQIAPTGPPPAARGPPPATGPPPSATPGSRPGTSQSQRSSTPGSAKFPSGDRSNIPPNSQPIYDILNPEMLRIQGKAPASFRPQVEDTSKRLGLLFDHLNNNDLEPQAIEQLKQLSAAMQARNFDEATAIHTELLKLLGGSNNWMVAVKRLITMSKATPL